MMLRVLTISLAALLMVAGFTTETGGFQERRMPPRRAVPIADRGRVANVRVSPLSAGYLAYYGYARPHMRTYGGRRYGVAPMGMRLQSRWVPGPTRIQVYRRPIRVPFVRHSAPRRRVVRYR